MNEVLTSSPEAIRISDGAVIRNRKGALYQSVRRGFKNTVKGAEIANFIFRDLRHAFASRLVMGGVDLPTVKRLMGHKEISMTLRYAHFFKRELRNH